MTINIEPLLLKVTDIAEGHINRTERTRTHIALKLTSLSSPTLHDPHARIFRHNEV